MATISERLQAEIDRANNTTSKTDTTVHSAIGSLVEGYGQGGEYLEVSSDSISLSNKKNEYTITIYSSGNWEASTADEWITLSQVSGVNKGTLTITVATATEDRNGTVALTCGTKTVNVSVEQVVDEEFYPEYLYTLADYGCYCKTDYCPNSKTNVKAKVLIKSTILSTQQYPFIFGARNGASSANDAIGITVQSNQSVFINGGDVISSSLVLQDRIITAEITDNVLTIKDNNDQKLWVIESMKTRTTSTYPLGIFTCNNQDNHNDSFDVFSNSKLYEFEISEDDTVVRKYVPYVKNKTIYLRDVVNDVLLEPIGSWGYSEEATTADYENAINELGD